MILDSLGGPYTDAAIASIANKGRLVVFGTSNDQQVTINLRRLYRKGVSLLGYSGLIDTAEDQRSAMDTLLAMMAAGSLRIPVGDVLPLADAAEAHARILERRVEGKLAARLPELVASPVRPSMVEMWRRQWLRRSRPAADCHEPGRAAAPRPDRPCDGRRSASLW